MPGVGFPQDRIEERKKEVRPSRREQKKEREGGEREEAGLDLQTELEDAEY